MFNGNTIYDHFQLVFVLYKVFIVQGKYFEITNVSIIRTDSSELVPSKSLPMCAVHCGISRGCNRLLYENHTRQCILVSYLQSDVLPVPNAWQLYQTAHRDCKVPDYFYDPITSTCMMLHLSTLLSWNDSRVKCQEDGGDLITIHNFKKWKYVLNFIGNEEKTWIGIVGDTWIDGNGFDNEKLNVTVDDVLFDYLQGNDCGALKIDKVSKFIKSEKCDKVEQYLCEILIGN